MVAENILNRKFDADRPGQKMVSDITYIPTDEGWLYLAGVMDLCGDKIVGISMDGRMTKELVLSGLKDAICHTKVTEERTRIYQQHEPERELLGQRPDGKFLGEVKAGMA